jgi:hypothetical protein
MVGWQQPVPGIDRELRCHFGTTSPPPFVGTSQDEEKSFEPGTLQYATKYYWRVVAKDANGDTESPSGTSPPKNHA